MKAAVTGAAGLLGRFVVSAAPAGIDVVPLDRDDLDITDRRRVIDVMGTVRPDVVVNCAAFADVDAAESDPETAHAVNGTGVQHLVASGVRVLHLSTDYVFDGSLRRPYRPTDATGPLSVYGRSKVEGEQHVLDSVGGAVVRTSRLSAPTGRSFVAAMLARMRRGDEIRIVDDQVAAPTDAAALADVLWRLVDRGARGVLHWTDAGACTPYEWACAIRDLGIECGLLRSVPDLGSVSASEFGAPAARPQYSVLDTTATSAVVDLQPESWRDRLGTMLREMAAAAGDSL